MKKMFFPVVLAAALILLGACSTVKSVPRHRAVVRLMELINSSDAEMVSSLSRIPMLVDGEIVQRPSDVENFWNLVTKARFAVNTMEDYDIRPVGKDTYRVFSDTMEVRTFFDKYVPETAVTVTVDSNSGKYVFLLSGRKGRYTYILGFTGPVE